MAPLPLNQAIPRFKDNEDRFDEFVNGDDEATWETSGSVEVPSVRKFLKDKGGEIEDSLTLKLPSVNIRSKIVADARPDPTKPTATEITAVVTEAKADRKWVVGSGVLDIEETINLEIVNVDMLNMRISASATGTFGSSVMVNIGGNGQNSETLTKRAYAWGEGDGGVIAGDADDLLNWATNKTLTGFRINADDGGATYDLRVSNLNIGVLVDGNTEKNRYFVSGTYCNIVVKETGSSPDTNKYYINGQACVQWFVSADDSTFNVDFNVESRYDFGGTIAAGYNAGINIPLPAVLIKNGKHAKLSGEMRAHNGRVNIYVDRDGTDNGADTLTFDGLSMVHMYGTSVLIDRLSSLRGSVFLKDSDNGRFNYYDAAEPPTVLMPAMKFNRVYSAGGALVTMNDIANRWGLSIGDATKGLYPVDVNFCNLTIAMRALDVERGQLPKGKTAFEIEKAVRCTFDFNEINGDIELGAGAQGNIIFVPATWVTRGYKVIKHADAADNKLIIKGSIKSSSILFKTWLFDGVIVDHLTDYDGASVTYRGSQWHYSGPQLSQPTASFSSISTIINSQFKRKGLMIFDTTTELPMWSTDTAATEANMQGEWTKVDGTGDIVPGYSVRTTDLLARMGTPCSTAMKLAYDRLYFNLEEAGILSKMILLYALCAHEEATAKLNLITDGLSASYDLTKVNAPVFTAFRGFVGDGTGYLSTGYDPSADSEGLAQNDNHIGVLSLNHGTNSYGSDFGDRAQRLKVRASVVARYNNFVGVSSNFTLPDAPPVHVVAARANGATQRGYSNGDLALSAASTSSSTPAGVVDLLRSGITSADYSQERQIAFAHLGLNLSSAEIRILSDQLFGFAAVAGAV